MCDETFFRLGNVDTYTYIPTDSNNNSSSGGG